MPKARKSPDEVRTAPVPVRLTVPEKLTLSEIAGERGIGLSTLIRNLALNRKMPKPRTPKVDLDTYRELQKVGINLNQIARQLNSVHMIPPFEKLKDAVKDLHSIVRALSKAVQ